MPYPDRINKLQHDIQPSAAKCNKWKSGSKKRSGARGIQVSHQQDNLTIQGLDGLGSSSAGSILTRTSSRNPSRKEDTSAPMPTGAS